VLVIDYPAVGKGPFPGVLLIHGSGANDKNETLGHVYKNGPKPPTILWQIAQYLSERGFAVLRYDKRGVGGYILSPVLLSTRISPKVSFISSAP
jgi:uncharacterized protein